MPSKAGWTSSLHRRTRSASSGSESRSKKGAFNILLVLQSLITYLNKRNEASCSLGCSVGPLWSSIPKSWDGSFRGLLGCYIFSRGPSCGLLKRTSGLVDLTRVVARSYTDLVVLLADPEPRQRRLAKTCLERSGTIEKHRGTSMSGTCQSKGARVRPPPETGSLKETPSERFCRRLNRGIASCSVPLP